MFLTPGKSRRKKWTNNTNSLGLLLKRKPKCFKKRMKVPLLSISRIKFKRFFLAVTSTN